MKILVTGANGMLAHDLIQQLKKEDWLVYTFSKQELDITQSESIQKQIENFKPNVVINCAAYTKVDQAESEEKSACGINWQGVKNLSNVCSQHKVKLVHVSTDFVFDGNQNEPYLENDVTHPQGVYGVTKLKGEQAIQNTNVNYLIVRTSWLYGAKGHNFVKTMLRLANERSELKVVDDQIGCPTWTFDLANALISLIKEKSLGIYHFSNQGQCSWYEFAKEAIEVAYHQKYITQIPKIFPIPTSEYPLPAKRPLFSVLNCEKYMQSTQQSPPEWKESLSKMIKTLSEK